MDLEFEAFSPTPFEDWCDDLAEKPAFLMFLGTLPSRTTLRKRHQPQKTPHLASFRRQCYVRENCNTLIGARTNVHWWYQFLQGLHKRRQLRPALAVGTQTIDLPPSLASQTRSGWNSHFVNGHRPRQCTNWRRGYTTHTPPSVYRIVCMSERHEVFTHPSGRFVPFTSLQYSSISQLCGAAHAEQSGEMVSFACQCT